MSQSPLTPKSSRVLFCDEGYVKQTTYLFENIDPKLIIPSIRIAQDQHILTILGSGIFEELKTQISSNTLTANNIKLLEEYVQPTLASWVITQMLPSLVYHLQNKGIQIKNSDNSESATKDDIIFLQEQYENSAKSYSQLLINYLRRNNADYPLYYNPGGSYGTQIDSRYGVVSEYFSGLVMPSINTCGNTSIIGLGIGIDLNNIS